MNSVFIFGCGTPRAPLSPHQMSQHIIVEADVPGASSSEKMCRMILRYATMGMESCPSGFLICGIAVDIMLNSCGCLKEFFVFGFT